MPRVQVLFAAIAVLPASSCVGQAELCTGDELDFSALGLSEGEWTAEGDDLEWWERMTVGPDGRPDSALMYRFGCEEPHLQPLVVGGRNRTERGRGFAVEQGEGASQLMAGSVTAEGFELEYSNTRGVPEEVGVTDVITGTRLPDGGIELQHRDADGETVMMAIVHAP